MDLRRFFTEYKLQINFSLARQCQQYRLSLRYSSFYFKMLVVPGCLYEIFHTHIAGNIVHIFYYFLYV